MDNKENELPVKDENNRATNEPGNAILVLKMMVYA